MTTSLQDPLRDLKTNVLGTFVCSRLHVPSPQMLYAYSTNKVYGDLEWLRQETVFPCLLP